MNIKKTLLVTVAVVALIVGAVTPAFASTTKNTPKRITNSADTSTISICIATACTGYIDNGNDAAGTFNITSNPNYYAKFRVENGLTGPGGVTFYEYADVSNGDCMTWSGPARDVVEKSVCGGQSTQYWRWDSSSGTIRNWYAEAAGETNTECMYYYNFNAAVTLSPCSPSGPAYNNDWEQN
jgi:hypothetical protein